MRGPYEGGRAIVPDECPRTAADLQPNIRTQCMASAAEIEGLQL